MCLVESKGFCLGSAAYGPAVRVQSSQWGKRRGSRVVKDAERWPGRSEQITEEQMGGNHQNACTSVAPATWLNSQGAPGFTF